jgi:hypothetical protein
MGERSETHQCATARREVMGFAALNLSYKGIGRDREAEG